jgi:methionyl-tRNA synthetase
MRRVMALADDANRYIDEKKPWVMARDEAQMDDVQAVCTQGINLFRSLMIYLTPVIPSVSDDARAFLQEDAWCWNDATTPLLGTTIAKFKPLLTRVEADQVSKMVEQSKRT